MGLPGVARLRRSGFRCPVIERAATEGQTMHVAVWGAFGTIGRAVTGALLTGGDTVRAVGRSAEKLARVFGETEKVEIVAADVATPDGARAAAEGADAIVYSLGLPYSKEAFAAYPPMMETAVAAARVAGVSRLLLISNVYSYGQPQTTTVSEDHPRKPCAVKGRYRMEQEDVALGAHGNGLETLVLRLPDFYGPHADLSMGNLVITPAVEGRRADLLGPVDRPHEFVFTPDVGPVVARLLKSPEGWGEAYNLGGTRTITIEEFAKLAFAAAGHEPRVRVAGPWMVRLLGLFSSTMRELVEMSYLLTDPVVLDDRKLRTLLGDVPKTSYEDGIRLTVGQLRNGNARD